MNSRIYLYFFNVQSRIIIILMYSPFGFQQWNLLFPLSMAQKFVRKIQLTFYLLPIVRFRKKDESVETRWHILKKCLKILLFDCPLHFFRLKYSNYSKIAEATIRILLLPTYLLAEWAPSLEKIPYPRDRDIFVWMGHWKHLDHRRCRDHFQVPN